MRGSNMFKVWLTWAVHYCSLFTKRGAWISHWILFWLPLPPPKVGNLRVRHCCTSALQWQVSRDSKHHLKPCMVQVPSVGSSWMSTVRSWNLKHKHAALLGSEMINLQNPIQYHYPLSRILPNIGLPFHFPSGTQLCTGTPRPHSGAFVPQCHALLAHLGVLKISPAGGGLLFSLYTSWQVDFTTLLVRVTWSKEVNAIMNKGTILQTWAKQTIWRSIGHNLSCILVPSLIPISSYLIIVSSSSSWGNHPLKNLDRPQFLPWLLHNISCQGPTPQESNSSLDVTMILWNELEWECSMILLIFTLLLHCYTKKSGIVIVRIGHQVPQSACLHKLDFFDQKIHKPIHVL